MTVRVLLFAAHREAAGTGGVDLDLPSGSTLNDLYARLENRFPPLGPLRPYTQFAVNHQIVDATYSLRPGDEVALIQPVSGGAGD